MFQVPARNIIKKEIMKNYENEQATSLKLLDSLDGRVTYHTYGLQPIKRGGIWLLQLITLMAVGTYKVRFLGNKML